MPTPELLDPNKEHTLILVEPDGFARGLTGEVLRHIEAKGYVLKGLKIKWASKELLEEHYAEHRNQHFFPGLLKFMSLGPLVAVVVEGDRVVGGVHVLMGTMNPTLTAPGTIRDGLGRDWGSKYVENVVHGSDSPTSVERKIALRFPELVYYERRGRGREAPQASPTWRFFADALHTETATACLHGSCSSLLQGIVEELMLWQHNAATIEQGLGGDSIRRCWSNASIMRHSDDDPVRRRCSTVQILRSSSNHQVQTMQSAAQSTSRRS